MMSKLVVLLAVASYASAAIIGAPAVGYAGYGGYAGYAAPAYGYAAPVVPKVVAPYGYAAPAIAKVVAPAIAKVAVPEPYDPNPQYSYSYDVQDPLTGDSKGQHETRSGDVVQGSYTLIEPDGSRRTVDYTADPVNGFNAVVHKEPAVVAKAVVPAVAKAVIPGISPFPAVAKAVLPAAPLGYARPYGYPVAAHAALPVASHYYG